MCVKSVASQNNIMKQKELFMRGLPVDSDVVRGLILRSWKRSRSYGVDPLERVPKSIDPVLTEKLCIENQHLIDSATATFKKMHSDTEMLASAFLISNPEGVLFYSYSIGAKNRDIYVPGTILNEQAIGTNGIGTCIVENKPIEVIGEEHFRSFGSHLSCSAAPILDEDHILHAVICVVQRKDQYHEHTHGMVKAISYVIQQQMRLEAILNQTNNIIELLNDGIIVISSDGVIKHINNKAGIIIGLKTLKAGDNFYQYIRKDLFFNKGAFLHDAFKDRELILNINEKKIRCICSAIHSPKYNNAVLVLREASRVRSAAMKIVGCTAHYTFKDILGNAPAFKDAIEEAKISACNNSNILLLGETGTGKEMFAQSIHNASNYNSGPFVAVNCGALPRSLLVSELFGYEEGAFTGAVKSGKPGKFELASDGTIFLDEIGDLPLEAQVALLRLLENGEIMRIGGTFSRKMNARIIAATNQDLEKSVEAGTFRMDLYYRLNVCAIYVPALRNRPGDTEFLAQHFLHNVAARRGKNILGFDPTVLQYFNAYRWPGNVRELENIVEQIVNMADRLYVSMENLPLSVLKKMQYIKANATTKPQKNKLYNNDIEGFESLSKVNNNELNLVKKILDEEKGNVRQAARVLGLSRAGLYLKIKRFNIDLENLRAKF